MNKTIFFFLTPLITIALFFSTQDINPLSEIVITTEQGSVRNHDYVQLNFLDGHNIKFGNGWRDIGFNNGTHVWSAGSEGSVDPFEYYQKAYAPTYGYTGASAVYVSQSVSSLGASCGLGSSKTTGTFVVLIQESDQNSVCNLLAPEWDISTISVFSTITDVSYRSDITAGALARNCDITMITYQPSTAGAGTLWDDIIGTISNTNYITDDNYCTIVANNYVKDLGSDADQMVQDNLANGWFAVGLKANNMVRSLDDHSMTFGAAAATHELQITYTEGPPPAPIVGCEDPITTLHTTSITNTTAVLAWTTPTTNGQTITGYQVNYTTPWGETLTVATNDTASTGTTYTLSPLTFNTHYSIRVQPWTNSTCHSPADGNRLDILTNPIFNPGNTPTFSNQTNPDVASCKFERTDINSTALFLNVTYPYTYDPKVNFHYKYAMTNNTYYNLTKSAPDNQHNETQFEFTGVDNEIIDVLFTDQNTNSTCKYIITQTQFELLNQIQAFRNGEFGTAGQFGAFDLVYLIGMVFAMIGLNRITPIVAGFFAATVTLALAYFQIISVPSVVVAALAVVILLLYANTRKQ